MKELSTELLPKSRSLRLTEGLFLRGCSVRSHITHLEHTRNIIMSSTPTATHSLHCTAAPSRALTSDRAALGIFGPKLYSLYINWQTSIENPDQAALYPSKAVWRRTVQAVRNQEVGGIPSAHTFKAFMNTKRVKARKRIMPSR